MSTVSVLKRLREVVNFDSETVFDDDDSLWDQLTPSSAPAPKQHHTFLKRLKGEDIKPSSESYIQEYDIDSD